MEFRNFHLTEDDILTIPIEVLLHPGTDGAYILIIVDEANEKTYVLQEYTQDFTEATLFGLVETEFIRGDPDD